MLILQLVCSNKHARCLCVFKDYKLLKSCLPVSAYLQAIVLPHGIWQEAVHGCWTQLMISSAVARAWNVNQTTLLHEVVSSAQDEHIHEVIDMIIEKNPRTLLTGSA